VFCFTFPIYGKLATIRTAERAGLSIENWQDLEAGRVPESWDQLCALAQGLGEKRVVMGSLVILQRVQTISFAAPLVGDLRQRPPQPAANCEGVRPADKSAPECVQSWWTIMQGSPS
jgi:hypothetical protein